MHDYTVALFLGFSFGNLWLCAILVFSLQASNKYTSLGYLAGRALTIIALSLIVSIIGTAVQPDRFYLNIFSGGLLIYFAGYLALTQLFGWVPPWRKPGSGEMEISHSSCDGECTSCPAHSHPDYADACSSCADHGVCSAEEPEVEALSRNAREVWGKNPEGDKKNGWWVGFTLGVFRGAAICTKLIVLIPILLKSSVPRALGLGTVFAVSSSVYPILGFIVGSFALKLVKFKRAIFIFSIILLGGSGILYYIRAFNHF